MIYGPECECGHSGPTITGYGPDDAEVVAVGIAPGRMEIKAGKPFQGPAGKRFDDVLKASGFTRDRVYCTNLCCYWKDKPEESEIAACWPRLRAELEARRPKLILALGALASEWLTGYKVGKVRGGIIDGSDLALTGRLWDYGHKQVYVLDRKAGSRVSEPKHFFADQDTIVACQVADRLRGGSGDWLSAVQMVVKHVGEPVVKVHPDLHVMSTWHPATTLGGRNPALVGDLVRDFKKIPRFLAGELSPIPFRQHEITSRREAQQVLHWLSGRVAALDVETTFDTPEKWGRLLCLSISTFIKPVDAYAFPFHKRYPHGCYVSYYFPREVLDDLDWPGSIRDGVRREGTLWGFHSGPFDRNVLRRELGVDLPIIWDSMYDSYSCDERPGYDRDDRAGGVGGGGSGRNKAIGPGYHNLDQLAREYCGAGFFKDATKDWIGVDPSNWVSPWSEDQAAVMRERWAALRERNALDAAYTMALPSRLPRGQSAPCYSTILLPAANAYADVSRTGIRIDVDRLRALESDWSAERSSMEKHLEEWAADLGYTNPPKRKRDTEGEPFNPASTTQLAKLLFGVKAPPDGEAGFAGLGVRSRVKTKKGKPSTSEEALQEIDHPFVLELLRLRKYANTLKYLPMIRTHLRPDGRVHPTFLPLVTGRYSALDPAMQTFPQPYKLAADGVPELAVLRSIIIPSEGHVLVETDYCVAPGTKVLKSDLTWVPIETLEVGEELVGFDECPLKSKFRSSVVQRKSFLKAESYRITTDKGEMVASNEHGFFTRPIHDSKGFRSKRRWVQAQNIHPGDRISFLARPWETDESRDGGYLAGFLDGEGYLSKTVTGFGQNDGDLADDVIEKFSRKGFQFHSASAGHTCRKYHLLGGSRETLRLLGSLRPSRLLAKSRRAWDGIQTWGKCSSPATVLSVENIGEQDVVGVQTSTGTIITDGFLSHNTQIEIWVGALLAQDEVMLADLKEPFEGGPPNYHSNVARNVLKCEEEVGSDVWEKTRRGAKVFTFGIEFGEGPDGLAKHASKEMGTKMGAHAAARIIKDWYDRYAVFAEWQRNQVRTARKQGYLENPFGFVRRFPFPDDVFKNQMYNSAIQGTASQHGTIALVELVNPMYFGLPYPRSDDEGEFTIYRGGSRLPFELSGYEPLHRAVGGNVLLSIHDSIVSEIPEDKVESGIAHIEQVMSHPRVPGWPGMKVESKVGADWFSMKSIKR